MGQKHILDKDKPLFKLIKKGDLPHCCFWGESGIGKTTLAKICAKETGLPFFYMDGTSFKAEEFRKIVDQFKNSLTKPIVFIDEIHRLSKNRQEILLIPIENRECILIGAMSENPSIYLTRALNSRLMNFRFEKLDARELEEILRRVEDKIDFQIDSEAKEYLVYSSDGDARAMLNLLEYALKISSHIDMELLKSLRNSPIKDSVSSKKNHYDFISALIKSIRGSDVNASLYYLAKLLVAGERSDFIARRLVILSSEDIGNANPNALNIATNTLLSVKEIGPPEDRIILSQCVIYLASSPKSNAAYRAIKEAMEYVENEKNSDIPDMFKRAFSKEYKNPHLFGGYIKQNYMEKEVKFHYSNHIGFEKKLQEWIEIIKGEK